jgi:hypothetical protein
MQQKYMMPDILHCVYKTDLTAAAEQQVGTCHNVPPVICHKVLRNM